MVYSVEYYVTVRKNEVGLCVPIGNNLYDIVSGK